MQAGVGYYSTSMVSYDLRALLLAKRLVRTAKDGSARSFTLATTVDSGRRVAQLETTLADLRAAIRESNFIDLNVKEARALKAELLAKFDGALGQALADKAESASGVRA